MWVLQGAFYTGTPYGGERGLGKGMSFRKSLLFISLLEKCFPQVCRQPGYEYRLLIAQQLYSTPGAFEYCLEELSPSYTAQYSTAPNPTAVQEFFLEERQATERLGGSGRLLDP